LRARVFSLSLAMSANSKSLREIRWVSDCNIHRAQSSQLFESACCTRRALEIGTEGPQMTTQTEQPIACASTREGCKLTTGATLENRHARRQHAFDISKSDSWMRIQEYITHHNDGQCEASATKIHMKSDNVAIKARHWVSSYWIRLRVYKKFIDCMESIFRSSQLLIHSFQSLLRCWLAFS
jgi:hypothetical protein